MQELDDITLKKAARGDQKAFKSLYDLYAPFIWKVLFPISERDMTTARELLQDTFVKVYEALRQFKGESALSTWLYRIAYTTAMGHTRKRKNRFRFQPYDDTLVGSNRTDTYDDRQLARKVLDSLSTNERFLLIAREIDGISFDDLSLITGQKSGALRTRLHRLKESIRKSFPQEQLTVSEV
ncbi:MAG: RNA polymerase sigma factor [Chitinispirillaceae bacterium]|nr:RNA polymerase sigma factor [Chitinispirillaceae bacterium]